jgi:hypothetical protein
MAPLPLAACSRLTVGGHAGLAVRGRCAGDRRYRRHAGLNVIMMVPMMPRRRAWGRGWWHIDRRRRRVGWRIAWRVDRWLVAWLVARRGRAVRERVNRRSDLSVRHVS